MTGINEYITYFIPTCSCFGIFCAQIFRSSFHIWRFEDQFELEGFCSTPVLGSKVKVMSESKQDAPGSGMIPNLLCPI